MALKIVEKECRQEGNKVVIVVEGADPGEVLSQAAKALALDKAAACGFQNCGINSQSGSYPVDGEGKTYDDWNDQSKRGLIAAYRNEIKLMGRL